MKKTKIVIFIGVFVPGWKAGGPIRTVLEMLRTAPNDTDITVVTSDRDLGDKRRYSGLAGRKATVESAEVVYVNWHNWREVYITALEQIQMRPDIVILNSFFDIRSSFIPLLLTSLRLTKGQLVLGPRGEFSPGALEISSTKKLAYMGIGRSLPAVKNAVWLATSPLEVQDINRHFPHARVIVAPDSPGTPPCNAVSPATDSVKFIFLSRISPMKNLSGALRALLNITPNATVHFDIYGSIEDPDYWAECQHIISTLPARVRVEYKGEVAPEQTAAVFALYDAFIFLTRGENFGHVIHEALSQGCPVILTDTTPWSKLIEGGGGFLCDNDSDAVDAVNHIANESRAERTRRKETARLSYSEWWAQSVASSKPPLELVISAIG